MKVLIRVTTLAPNQYILQSRKCYYFYSYDKLYSCYENGVLYIHHKLMSDTTDRYSFKFYDYLSKRLLLHDAFSDLPKEYMDLHRVINKYVRVPHVERGENLYIKASNFD